MVIPRKSFKHDFQVTPKLELIVENGKRLYRVPSGNLYPSVTSILSELPNKGLENWRKRVGEKEAEKITKQASSRGSLLHHVAEKYLKNESPNFTDPFQKSLFNKVHSTLNNIDNIKTIEQSLYSDRLKFAGTPDCIAEYGGILSIIDFKTSTKIKEEKYIQNYYMQCGAYAIMYEELYGIRPQQCVVIIAVEESNIPQVFKKDSTECFQILKDYVVKLASYRRSNNEHIH